MTPAIETPLEHEQVIILRDVTWATYDSLLRDCGERSNPRISYSKGVLELVSLSAEHERLKDMFVLLINAVAETLELDVASFGSTTFRRQDLDRGFEPDACFYFQNAGLVADKKRLELPADPPPDLVVEIDLTHRSLDKLPIYAEVGVAEVWRYTEENFFILKLENNLYQPQAASLALPVLTTQAITDFISASRTPKRAAWLRRIREWTASVKRDS